MVELLVGSKVVCQLCKISGFHRPVGTHGGQIQRSGGGFRAYDTSIYRIPRIFGYGYGICRTSLSVNAKIHNAVGKHDRHIGTADIRGYAGSTCLAVGYRPDAAVTANAESVCASAVA